METCKYDSNNSCNRLQCLANATAGLESAKLEFAEAARPVIHHLTYVNDAPDNEEAIVAGKKLEILNTLTEMQKCALSKLEDKDPMGV